MTSTARRLGLMLLGLGIVLGTIAGINWIVNPYGAWRSTVIDPVYRFGERTRNEADERVTIAYRISAERPINLLVGSFRVVVGMYIDRGSRDGFFNASMSGASLAEIAAVLRRATVNHRLKRVIWGVDFYAFDRRFAGFRHPETRARLEGDVAHFWPAVGHVMLRQLLGEGCPQCGAMADAVRSAGVWVDARSIDGHLVQQETARRATRFAGDRCTKVVEGMLRERGAAAQAPAAPGSESVRQ